MAMASMSNGTAPTPFNLRYVLMYANNNHSEYSMQPGVFEEANLQRLDFVLDYGARVGLRFTLALVNGWPDYGGRLWYVRTLVGPDASEDEFYTNPATRAAYKQWVRLTVAAAWRATLVDTLQVTYLLTRRNVYNGRRYADDPAIFSLNLCNEPTASPGLDASRGVPPGATIAAWVGEMAAHVKSIDSNHLLSVGDVR